ncbi:MAG: helix-turn-helix domain-containing protein [Betaproteobacteria bacterium]|nr:MAG: helix-turn-helix domain-containing protein [Betaproteobacteria bacterium]
MALKSRLVDALKACLKARALTYGALAKRLGLSEPTVKRMFSRGSFTLERIERILEVIELDLQELARLAREGSPAPAELTQEQEFGLARDERLFSVFWLVQNQWSFAEIVAGFAISRAELTAAYARLEHLQLIRWGPGERARLLVRRDFRWRDGGPVKKTYGPRVMSEFLAARFKQPLEFLRFESRQMSPESAALLKRRLERLALDFNELAEADSAAPGGKRIGVALLAACRPWEFSVVHGLKRRG